MPKQCHDPKCIANKETLTTHKKCKSKEKNPSSPSTSYENSLDNSTTSQNKKQKRSKPKLKHSKDGSKSSETLFNKKSKACRNKKCRVVQSTPGSSILTRLHQKLRMRSTKPNAFEQISGSSQNYMEQICTCRKSEHRNSRSSGSLHGHANSQNVSMEKSKRRRKKSRRRHKKASKRESDRRRHDCFTRLCVCVRGRSSDELRACKCTSSREISSSNHECCCVKTRQRKGTNHLTSKSILRNNIQTSRYSANPASTSEVKPQFKQPDELLQEKTNAKRNVIIKELNTIRKAINRFGARTIRLFQSEK